MNRHYFHICLVLMLWQLCLAKADVAFFCDYVDVRGLPSGICPLTPEQARQRGQYYAITTEQGRITKVEHLNAVGRLIPTVAGHLALKPAAYAYRYSPSGAVSHLAVFDGESSSPIAEFVRQGDCWRFIHDAMLESAPDVAHGGDSTSTTVVIPSQYDRIPHLISVGWGLGAHGTPRIIKCYYDELGRLRREHFLQLDGLPMADNVGAHGRLWEYDSSGRVLRVMLLNASGQIAPVRCGAAGIQVCYDEQGIPRQFQAITAQRELHDALPPMDSPQITTSPHENDTTKVEYKFPAQANLPYSKLTHVFNGIGVCVSEEYSTESGEEVANPTRGYARAVRSYDAQGRCISIARDNGRTCFIYDAIGNPVKQSLFDAIGKAQSIVQKEFDARGRPIKITYHQVLDEGINSDAKSSLVLLGSETLIYAPASDAVATRVVQNAEGGVLYSFQRRSADNASAGFYTISADARDNTITHVTHNAAGHITMIGYYDLQRVPKTIDKEGFHKQTFCYDVKGQCVEVACYGVTGEPVCLPMEAQIARRVFERDELGRVISESCYDTKGQLIAPIVLRKYDARNLLVEESYCSADNVPMNLPGTGYGMKRYSYNDSGCLVAISFHSPTGILVGPLAGKIRKPATISYKYNDLGQLIELSFYDAKGKLFFNPEFKFARETYTYSGLNCFSGSVVSTDGKPPTAKTKKSTPKPKKR